MTRSRITSALSGLALIAAALFVAPMQASSADTTCTPQASYTETIQHPAVTQVVHHDAVPSLWWNWSPNRDQGPFEGPPAFPVDARGTWQGPHSEGGPSQDTFGTFQQGNGNGDWFHREPGVDAYDETVVVTAAYEETITHPAVTCPEVPVETPAPTQTPVVPSETPEAPVVTPDVPVETPSAPEEDEEVFPAPHCLGNALVTETAAGVSIENGAPECAAPARRSAPVVIEEGL